jgi:hypothetical protein
MPIEHKTINTTSKLNEYRSNSINRRVSYATKQILEIKKVDIDNIDTANSALIATVMITGRLLLTKQNSLLK